MITITQTHTHTHTHLIATHTSQTHAASVDVWSGAGQRLWVFICGRSLYSAKYEAGNYSEKLHPLRARDEHEYLSTWVLRNDQSEKQFIFNIMIGYIYVEAHSLFYWWLIRLSRMSVVNFK